MNKAKMRVASLLIGALMLVELVCEPCLSVSAQGVEQPSYEEIQAGQKITSEVKKNEKEMYAFHPEKTADYVISSQGEKDTCVQVYDENMNEVSQDNDSGEDFNFEVTVSMDEASTYYVEVGLFQLDDEGEIVWQVEEKPQTQEVTETQETQLNQMTVESQSNIVASSSGDFKTKVLSNGTVAITDYTGSESVIKIPSSIGGKQVTVIGKQAFESYDRTVWNFVDGEWITKKDQKNINVQKVIIPKTVVEIQYRAFAGCNKLKTVSFEKGSKLKKLGDSSFVWDKSLSSIKLPASTQKIGDACFSGCSQITDCGLGSLKSLQKIGADSFSGTGLKKIDIPDSVKTMGEGAFYGCIKAKKVVIGKKIKTIPAYAFGYTGFSSIKIPSNVKEIQNNAFAYSALKSVTIPSTVQIMGTSVFWGCEKLKSATIKNDKLDLPVGTFGNSGIQNVKLGKKSVVIGEDSFCGAKLLKTIQIPDSVTEIQYQAFKNSTSLSKITFPKSLKKLGGECFTNTKWYKNQKNGMVYAGKVFYTYKGKLPKNKSVSIKSGTKGISGFAMPDTDVKSVTIPDSVTNIGEAAFFNCTNLKSVYVPASVKEIGEGAFGMVSSGYGARNSIYLGGHIGSYAQKQQGFTIIGVKGSAAEAYAKQYGITFKPCYKVVFKVGKKVVSTQYVEKGKSAKAPTKAQKGYAITWNKKFDKVKSNMTVTGKWRNYLEITLDNGGANTTGTRKLFEKYKKSFSSTAAFKIKVSKIAVPKKDGYIFGGYYTKKNGKGTKCIDKKGKICIKTNVISKDTTLYAKWTATKYNVVLHANDGTDNTQTIACVYDQKTNLANISRQGYRLEAWTTGSDGSGTAYSPDGEIINLTKDGTTIHLYAKWKRMDGEAMAQLALSEATGQTYAGSVYITEVGGVRNKYNNSDGSAWCAAFVSWCANNLGVPTSVLPRDAYVPSLYTKLISNCGAQVVTTPKAGDLVFYKSGGKFIHVGLMVNERQSVQGNVYVQTNGGFRSYLVKMDDVNLYRDENEQPCQVTYVRPNY